MFNSRSISVLASTLAALVFVGWLASFNFNHPSLFEPHAPVASAQAR